MENGNITLFIILTVIVVIAIVAILYDNITHLQIVHDTYQNTNISISTEGQYSGVEKSNRFKYAPPDVVTQIYKLLYIIDKIFTENKLEYWMDGGTFLGAVRHNGIIPHDDDGDIQVWESDEPLIRSLAPELAKHNITLKPVWFGYKIYFNDAKSIAGFEWLYPAIDIFLVKAVNNKLVYSSPKAQQLWSNCYHDLETLYPLKRYKFGSIELLGASNSTNYLNRCYGGDWATFAYQQFDHQNEKEIKNKIKIKLTPDELQPAQPIFFNKNFYK